MHLALLNGHDQLATSMVTVIDSELVRVKGKGRITPLHLVAQMDNIDLLAEFLSDCPSSIEDLTVRCETAVHVAVKNGRLSAFKVLLGWLQRVNMEKILEWNDEDSNIVLHIATSTCQPQIVKLLIGTVNVNAKNLNGLTAMDMFNLMGDSRDNKVGKILHRAKAKPSSKVAYPTSLAQFFFRDLTLIEKRDKYFGVSGQNQKKSADYIRNIVLVVAVLIATATYQAGLSPPGGYWQDDHFNVQPSMIINDTTTSDVNQWQQEPHRARQMIMTPKFLFYFFTLNSLAFFASVWMILVLIPGLPHTKILSISTSFLLYAYYASIASTLPEHYSPVSTVLGALFMFLTPICIVMVFLSPLVSSRRLEVLKCQGGQLEKTRGRFRIILNMRQSFTMLLLITSIMSSTCDGC
ncbi:hypothetical protein Dsin_028866 [Dipteronia sinensis]|uniref:PGG domain-containing protein n=1 Tax=Dipteronia sinensis TaxID=43782 RepID=A0AAD9ZS20_9ROSI|nr:hypothetical protein Dsin_028866 [Dipteronia sinensis]